MTDAKLTPNVRPCGDCALCCKITPIESEELTSPPTQWCPHWKGKCTIYEDRFPVCREFYCLWNLGLIPEELAPRKTKCILAIYREGVLIVYNDPAYPGKWEEGDMGLFLMNWGEKFVVQTGEERVVIYPKGGIDA